MTVAVRGSLARRADRYLGQLHSAVHSALVQIDGARTQQSIPFTRPPKGHSSNADLCVPCFSFAVKQSSKQLTAPDIAAQLAQLLRSELIDRCASAGPYLNLHLNPAPYVTAGLEDVNETLATVNQSLGHDKAKQDAQPHVIEFSSPNTNKPQHLGHARNAAIGECVARLWEIDGRRVCRVNLVNDRGVHICKSMLAYQKRGDGETPESSGIKGDHLVGKYYVLYEQMLQDEYAGWLKSEPAKQKYDGWLNSLESNEPPETRKKKKPKRDTSFEAFSSQYKQRWVKEESKLGLEAIQMLGQWEEGDADVRALWMKMREWCINGFDTTYQRLGIHFDEIDYESDTYMHGKAVVMEGLKNGDATKTEDGAVVIATGKSQSKVLLRADGTSVYTTQVRMNDPVYEFVKPAVGFRDCSAPL